MHGQYLEQRALTRPAGFYARGLSRRRVPRWPCHCCCAFQEGRKMGQEVYIHPPPPPRCKPRDKTPRKYLGFGSRALSPARYERERERERVVRCHVQWPRDPLTNLSPSWCSKITETRLRSCTNNSSNGSLFYYPSPSLLFPRIDKGEREETARFER